MMRSLFSAISGLRGHQQMMDIVGNNIANVNTTAFKSARVTFQDIIGQTVRAATGPTTQLGGLNPMQVGLGVQTATVDLMMLQGNLQSTNKPTDVAIQGDGFFVISDNAATPAYYYTRDGNFDLGVTTGGAPRPLIHASSGLHVKGYIPPLAAGTADSATAPATDVSIPATSGGVAVSGFNIDTNGIVTLVLTNGTTVANYAQLAVATFPNYGGLQRLGGNQFLPSANSGAPAFNGAYQSGRGQVSAGFLEMSNVDLAREFTNMIIAERGFQANSRVITTSDEILADLVNIKR